jgi:hypothetical protein
MGRSTPSSDVIARAYDEATWQLSFMRIGKRNAIFLPPTAATRLRRRPLHARDAGGCPTV